jgi:type IV secretion system protein VirD4
VRGLHVRLAAAVDEEGGFADEEGGLQQQRHPGLPEEGVTKPVAPEHEADLGLAEDESDSAADKRAMDRLRGLSSVARAHAMNEGAGGDDDLLPSF